MSVELHPDIEQLEKSSLCYSIYSQLYLNFFNAQDRKDEEHPFGIVEGDATSIRLKNSAYGFASAIAGSVAGEGSNGESSGILLDYLKKSGGNMSGLLRANYGFEAGVDNIHVLSVYAEPHTNTYGEITGTDYGIRISGDLQVGGENFYLGNCKVLSYDGVSDIAFLDAGVINFGISQLLSQGEIIIGENREKGILIGPTFLHVGGKNVYHAGNANTEHVDWQMQDGFVEGCLKVSGESIFSNRIQALNGVDIGYDGNVIIQVVRDEMALNGYLSFGSGYGVKINDIPVLFRAGEKEVQLGSTGGALLLGGLYTTKIQLLSGITDMAGDYVLVSSSGDGYFPGSLVVRHNRGEDLLSTYRADVNDEGIILHKRLRFGTAGGVSLSGDSGKISFSSYVKQEQEDARIMHSCVSHLEHCLSSSLYRPQNRDSYAFHIDTDADILESGVPIETKDYIGISGSYTRLINGSLFFDEETRLQVINGGIKHYGNSIFRGTLSSELFSTGFAGSGWGILYNRTTGKVTATFDEVVIRRKLHAYEQEVTKVSVTSGSFWVSDSCSGDSVEKV